MDVDMSGPIKRQMDLTLQSARVLEGDGKSREASAEYLKVARLMKRYADCATSLNDEKRRLHKAEKFLQYAEVLKNRALSGGKKNGSNGRRTSVPDHDGDQSHTDEIMDMIHRSSVTWDQIGGLAAVKREIKFTYGLALAEKPEGVRIDGWKRILFYGPPGTGKTLLAAAASNGLDATFFNVKVGGLLSKYFGESSHIISTLFEAARSEADAGFSLVFIDEVDSLVLPRGGGSESGAERRVLSTLLSELDGMSEKGTDCFVLTVAATNAPWDLDDAVLSRFQKRIHIPLPDASARNSILKILLEKQGHKLTFPLKDVVDKTEFFSGRDLARMANQAVNVMLEELNGGIPDVIDRGRKSIGEYRVKVRALKREDFNAAFQRIRVDTKRQRELEARYREFGTRN